MSLKYNGSNPVVDCQGKGSLTVQSDRDSADINKIIQRLEKGTMIDRLAMKEPFYGDVSEFDGLAAAIMKVNEAQDLFMNYNAELREKFDNDPVKFVEFFENPANLEEAYKLGLAVKQPVVPPPAPNPAP